MPSLRDEITRTIHRFRKRGDSRHPAASLAETTVSSDPREGKLYHSYRILKRIGAGGMGQVYLALDTRLDRRVALKFLSPPFTADPSMLRRLQEEASTASRLNHPGILTIYEIVQAGSEHFMASEYVEGVTFRALIEKGEVPPERALEIVSDVASALVAAHRAGVVHRDLKPSNIMVREDGLVKVIDFGLAKNTLADGGGQSRQFTNAGTITGTVEYMSPEQARGEATDHRSDIWSLGVVLYESLCKKLPFDGETESHVVVGILDRPLPPLPYNPAFPRGVTKILERALAKNREQRYQSTREMLADLQALGTPAQRASAFRRLAALPRRNHTWIMPLAVLGAVVLTALGLWWWPFHGKEWALGPAWFEPGPAEQITHYGNVKLAAISPNGKYLAYTTRTDRAEELRIRNLTTQAESKIPPFEGRSFSLTFSPDSQILYYVLKDRKEWGRLFSAGVTSAIPKFTLQDIDGPVTFSPDGEQFAFMRRVEGTEQKRESQESIMIVSARDTGEQRAIASKANAQIGSVAWSPRGDRISAVVHKAVLSQAGQATLSLFTPSGVLKEEFLDASLRTIKQQAWLNSGSLLAFSAIPQGSEHVQLYEWSVRAKRFRPMPAPPLTIDSLGATADGKTIAAVAVKQTSALSTAPAGRPDSAAQRLAENDFIGTVAWSNSGGLLFPSNRGGAVNLWEADSTGKARPLGQPKNCVERIPAPVPNSSQVVYSSNCAGGDDFNLWQIDSTTGERLQLTSGSTYDDTPVVTPDGKWIIYTSWPSNICSLWKIAVGGGMAVPLGPRAPQEARNPKISPDGKWILCQMRELSNGTWRAAILSAADGATQQDLPDLPAAADVVMHWSPDGTAIDFVEDQGAVSNIWRRPLNGEARQLTHFSRDKIYDFAWDKNGTMLAYSRGHAQSDVVFFHRAAVSH